MDIKVRVKFTDAEAAALAISAHAAIAYWAISSACVGKATTLFVDAHDMGTDEASKCLKDKNYQYRVRKVDLERGLALALQSLHFPSVTEQLRDFGPAGLDRDAVDVVIQLAVYGKVLFG